MSDLTLLYGPTACGKSSIALNWADQNDGIIINSDALQIYNALPILTAQPTTLEQSTAPHFLYGTHDPTKAMDAHSWALEAVNIVTNNSQKPIITGGTGLYIKTVLEGLSIIPDIDPRYRLQSEELYQELGADGFQEKLKEIDPQSATNIHANNRQRMVRAYEVYLGTGKPFSNWRNAPKNPVLPTDISYHLYVLLPKKDLVIQRAANRFDHMIDRGVIDEVKRYTKQYPHGSAADQALGLQIFQHYLEGYFSLEEVKSRTLLETNQYIKRQYTWARGQFKDLKNVTIIETGDPLTKA